MAKRFLKYETENSPSGVSPDGVFEGGSGGGSSTVIEMEYIKMAEILEITNGYSVEEVIQMANNGEKLEAVVRSGGVSYVLPLVEYNASEALFMTLGLATMVSGAFNIIQVRFLGSEVTFEHIELFGSDTPIE